MSGRSKNLQPPPKTGAPSRRPPKKAVEPIGESGFSEEQEQEEELAEQSPESWLGDTDALDFGDDSEDEAEENKGDSAAGARGAEAKGTAIVPAASSRQGLSRSRREDLEPGDLLQRYMADVSRYPLLTREEEVELAKKYAETGDAQYAYRLVTANLRLVVKIAWEYRRAAFNILDLIQEGNVGLMQAVRKFDVERNVKLSTYSAWWIRAYIIRYLMDNWRLVKLGTTQAQRKLFFNLNKEKERLAQEGFEPEPRLLAERLQVTEQEVVDMDIRLSSSDHSLQTPVADDSGVVWQDRIEQEGEALDERLADAQVSEMFSELLAKFAKGLEGREKFIYENRLLSDSPLTLQEVGDHFGFSRERARQIEARLVKNIKAYMEEHMPDFADLQLEAGKD